MASPAVAALPSDGGVVQPTPANDAAPTAAAAAAVAAVAPASEAPAPAAESTLAAPATAPADTTSTARTVVVFDERMLLHATAPLDLIDGVRTGHHLERAVRILTIFHRDRKSVV